MLSCFITITDRVLCRRCWRVENVTFPLLFRAKAAVMEPARGMFSIHFRASLTDILAVCSRIPSSQHLQDFTCVRKFFVDVESFVSRYLMIFLKCRLVQCSGTRVLGGCHRKWFLESGERMRRRQHSILLAGRLRWAVSLFRYRVMIDVHSPSSSSTFLQNSTSSKLDSDW